jgi:hypothetical protein
MMHPMSMFGGRSTATYGAGFFVAVLAALSAVTPAAAIGESPAKAYVLHCTGCHMKDGMGAKIGRVPAVPGITGHILKHPKGRIYLTHVPGVVNAGLPDNETAAVLNYMLQTYAKAEMPPDAKPFTGQEIQELRKIKVDDITLLRMEIKADLAKQGIELRN